MTFPHWKSYRSLSAWCSLTSGVLSIYYVVYPAAHATQALEASNLNSAAPCPTPDFDGFVELVYVHLRWQYQSGRTVFLRHYVTASAPKPVKARYEYISTSLCLGQMLSTSADGDRSSDRPCTLCTIAPHPCLDAFSIPANETGALSPTSLTRRRYYLTVYGHRACYHNSCHWVVWYDSRSLELAS